jgi:hypothetical protein
MVVEYWELFLIWKKNCMAASWATKTLGCIPVRTGVATKLLRRSHSETSRAAQSQTRSKELCNQFPLSIHKCVYHQKGKINLTGIKPSTPKILFLNVSWGNFSFHNYSKWQVHLQQLVNIHDLYKESKLHVFVILLDFDHYMWCWCYIRRQKMMML